jgi:uncharacterized protein YraI
LPDARTLRGPVRDEAGETEIVMAPVAVTATRSVPVTTDVNMRARPTTPHR